MLQFVQYMSATVCSPVRRSRSSLGPSVTLTLQGFETQYVPAELMYIGICVQLDQNRSKESAADIHVAEEKRPAVPPLK